MVHAQPKMCKLSKSFDVLHQADIRVCSHCFKFLISLLQVVDSLVVCRKLAINRLLQVVTSL